MLDRLRRQLLPALGAALLVLPAAAGAAEGTPDPAREWDALWLKTLVDIVIIGVVFGAMAIWWMFKYRARSADDVGRGPNLTKAQAVAWALIPAAVFMADDFFLAAKGWEVWNTYRRVPDDALEVKVTGYQWFWEFDYGNGVVESELTVPVGRPVVLRMTAPDVIHSFYVPEYRVKEDVMPGRVTYLWFLPTEEKVAPVLCTEFCGTAHSQMMTQVVAIPEAEFEAWMKERRTAAAQPADGTRLAAAVGQNQ